jgi:hypothetical protein
MHFVDFFVFFMELTTNLAVLNLQKYEIKIFTFVHGRLSLDNHLV